MRWATADCSWGWGPIPEISRRQSARTPVPPGRRHRKQQQHDRAIRDAPGGDEVDDAIDGADPQGDRADWRENSQWAEDRNHLQENQQEAYALRAQPIFGFRPCRPCVDRLEADAVAGLQERQRRCRRSGEAIRQQVQELQQNLSSGARKPDVRSGIRRPRGGQRASSARRCRRRTTVAAKTRSRADDEIVCRGGTSRSASSARCCPSASRIRMNSPVAWRTPS